MTVLVVALACQIASAASTARHPFPRNAPYPYGIASTRVPDAANKVQRQFQLWDSVLFHERDGEAAITRSSSSTSPRSFVSSELAYGMLIMVYMDNQENDTRRKFDMLLSSYDRWLDSNGLMNWWIEWGVNTPTRVFPDTIQGKFAATDADMDAAMALLLAHKQWGDNRYLVRAKDLIGRIWKHEVDSAKTLKPGDDWNPYKNPSYLNFAAMHLFAQVDTNDWKTVADNSWRMLRANTSPPHSPSRLPSDWCAPDGTPVAGKRNGIGFNYDAIRVPLRTGLAWSWFGDTAAHTIDSNIAAFALSPSYGIQGRPDSIYSGYKLDGSRAVYMTSAFPFVIPLTGAGMVDKRFHDWVDTGFARMSAYKWYSDPYIGSLSILYLLHMSGNFNDLWNAPSPTSIPSAQVAPSAPKLERDGHALRVRLPNTASAPRLLDANGRLVAMGSQSVSGAAWTIPTSRLGRGVYFLRWQDGVHQGTIPTTIGVR